MKKLAIILTHPIQYYTPIFQGLSAKKIIAVKVFYTWSQAQTENKFDPGFQRYIKWDIPLLNGYDYEFVTNTSKKPGSDHYNGIINPTLINRIENWSPNAILIFGWKFSSHLACLRYFNGKIPVFFRGDSHLLDEQSGFSIKKILRRLFLTWIYSHVDYAFYVGSANKDYYLKHGLEEHQLFYAPHAIDNNRFSSISQDEEQELNEWHDQLGLANCFVVLFVGKLENKKNPSFLLEVAKLVKNENVRFVVVGNGPLEIELREKAKGDERFVFVEFQNQRKMPLVYRLANLFILPSIGPGETWGLSINEAMACKLPVVATTKVGGAWDLIEQGKNGLIISPKSYRQVAEFINSAITHPDEFEKYGLNSQKKIKAFTIDKIVEEIEWVIGRVENINNKWILRE